MEVDGEEDGFMEEAMEEDEASPAAVQGELGALV